MSARPALGATGVLEVIGTRRGSNRQGADAGVGPGAGFAQPTPTTCSHCSTRSRWSNPDPAPLDVGHGMLRC